MSAKRALIVGGSIGGLFAGLSLLREGWDVQVFEAASELGGRGAGITTHQVLFDVLSELEIATGDHVGLRIHQRKTFARDGSELGSYAHTQIVTSWGRLYRLLRAAFPAHRYHTGCSFKFCQQTDCGVEASFSDGRREQGSILVAADGIRSAVRQQLQGDVQPEYAGYVAWRGMVTEESCIAAGAADVLPYFTFCLPPGEQCLAYPVYGDEPSMKKNSAGDKASSGNTAVDKGKRMYNLVWYRPADRQSELRDLLTDINGHNNGASIAPDKIRPQVIDSMREASKGLLSPQHAAIVEKIEQPFIQPVYDVMSQSMVCGRVVWIGDAAFTARPHLGMGVTKVAEDARALASSLAREPDTDAALMRFKEIRQPVNEMIVARSRQLGTYLQAGYNSDVEHRFAEQHRSPDAVMRETATDEFLKDYNLAKDRQSRSDAPRNQRSM